MIIENNEYNDKIIQFVQFCRDEEKFEEARLNLKNALTNEEWNHATEQDVLDMMLQDFNPDTDTVIYPYAKEVDD
jgi:hypothetical protein